MRIGNLPVVVSLLLVSAVCGQVPDGPVQIGSGEPPSAEADDGGPKLVVEQEIIDLGTVKEGETVDAVFVLENRGQADLIIKHIRTSCGCTTVKLKEDEKIIPPGGKQTVTARFNTKGRPGKQRKTITVTTNDYQRPSLKLTLTTEVLTLARVIPATLLVRNVRRGEVIARTLEVLPGNEGAEVEIVSLEVPGNVLTFTSEPIERQGGLGHRLRFVVDPDAPLGVLSGTAVLTVRVGDQTETKHIRIQGEIIGDLSVRPPSIRLDKPSARGIELRPVTISSGAGKPFRVLGASAGPNFKITVKPGKKNLEYTVLLEIAEDAADGPCGAFLEVRTDSVVQPLVRVPVYVNVAPRLRVDPPIILLLGDGSANERACRVMLSTPTGSGFSVLSATCAADFIDISPAESERERPDRKVFRVALTGALESGTRTATILLTTDVPGAQKIEVPVTVMMAEGA